MAKLDILIKATNDASGPIGAVQKSLGSLGSAAKATVMAAGVAAAGAVTAVTAAVGIGVGKAAELEQATADIASVMGITFDQAKPLSDLIQNLGLDPKLKVDAMGASDAIMQLAQSGVSMDAILNGAARSTVLLANATGGDMATSAAVASDAMSLFGIKAGDMQKAVNGITGVTIASKFGINDYQLALAAAGGVASAVGVSFDDFNSTIAAISPYFASGSDAGTSFKTFLLQLVPQTKEATAEMQRLGLMTADGKNAFFDANGQMKSMTEIAGLLANATKGMSEEQQNATFKVLFGTDAMRAAFAVSKEGAAGFTEVAGALGKIDAEAQAATRMNTFSSQMEILQGVIDGLLTQIGQAFLPTLRSLANWATDWASNNGPALVAWFTALGAWLQASMPTIVAWAQVFVGAFGEIYDWLSGKHTDWGYLKQVWALFEYYARTFLQGVIDFVQRNLPNWLAELAKWAQAGWQWVVDITPTVVQKLTEYGAAAFKWVQDNLPTWTSNLAAWGQKAWQWIVDAAPTVLAKLNSLWSDTIKPWLDDHTPKWGTAWEDWGKKASGVIGDMAKGFATAWPEISKTVKTAADNITADIDRILASLGKISSWFSGGTASAGVMDWALFWTRVAKIIATAEEKVVAAGANFIESLVLLIEATKAFASGDLAKEAELLQRFSQLQSAGNFLAGIQDIWNAANWSPEGRALGGPVQAGQPYWVGERGRPELFVPQQNGTIVPDGATTNVYNTFHVNLAGTGAAGSDVLSTVQLMQMMYG